MKQCEYGECEETELYPLITSTEGGGTKRYMLCQEHHQKAKEYLNKRPENIRSRMAGLFGEKFADATFNNFVTDPEKLKKLAKYHGGSFSEQQLRSIKEAKEDVSAFVDQSVSDPSGTILLFGREGLGKTHLAAASVRRMIESGSNAAVWYSTRLLAQIRDTYSRSPSEKSETVKSIIETMTSRDVLVLEDIRESCFSTDIKDYIFDIVNSVYREEGMLIMTSNFTVQELRAEDRLGPHLVDRIIDPPSCVKHIKGSFSYRAAKKAYKKQSNQS
jgi:DNA replication protein DnaC